MLKACLFIYGSMFEGNVHYKKLEPFIESKQSAKVKGAVYRLDVGYPIFSEEPLHDVQGAIVRLVESPLIWPILDELHGFNAKNPEKSLFFRKETMAETNTGEVLASYVYVVNPAKLPKTAKLIPEGDWVSDLSNNEPITKSLTDNQRRYISRLGASSGRDIVPINLELYRELINKGLIIDKGRRLALTSLGKEVLRYLED